MQTQRAAEKLLICHNQDRLQSVEDTAEAFSPL